MRNVFFHGWLADQYGEKLRLNIDDVGGLIRLMEANYPGKFVNSIRDGKYHIVMGRDLDFGRGMTEEMLPMKLGSQDIHVVPVIEGHGGGGKKGIFPIILGIGLIATGFIGAAGLAGTGLAGSMSATAFSIGGFGVSWGQLAMTGLSLALQGMSGMLTTTPRVKDYGERQTPDEKPSFLFNGAINMSGEGGPVPLAYGRVMSGSVVVSGGIDIEQVQA